VAYRLMFFSPVPTPGIFATKSKKMVTLTMRNQNQKQQLLRASLLHARARAQKQLFQTRPSNVAFHTHFNPDIPPGSAF